MLFCCFFGTNSSKWSRRGFSDVSVDTLPTDIRLIVWLYSVKNYWFNEWTLWRNPCVYLMYNVMCVFDIYSVYPWIVKRTWSQYWSGLLSRITDYWRQQCSVELKRRLALAKHTLIIKKNNFTSKYINIKAIKISQKHLFRVPCCMKLNDCWTLRKQEKTRLEADEM